MPLVTVIVHTYNQEKYIEKAIKSALNQKTDFDYEIIVVDDASEDSTREIIDRIIMESQGAITPIYHQTNYFSKGDISFSEEINMAQGDFISFLDGDDFFLDENKLQKECDALRKHPSCVMCSHPVQRIDEYDNPIKDELDDLLYSIFPEKRKD